MPKVSVITGAYNCAASLPAAVASIQSQSFTDWELILCNDASGDNTLQVAQQLAAADSRIKVISNATNQGLAATLNHCLEHCSGEYVARMDTDDLCLPHRFMAQVQYLDEHPEMAVVGGGIHLFDENGDKDVLLNPAQPTARWMKRNIPFFHPTIMMRRSAYDALGGYTVCPRTRRGQDMDLWFRFFAMGFRGANLQEAVLKYHDNIADYNKKSSFAVAWGMTRTKLMGFRINKFPIHLYPYAFIPVLTWMAPRRLVYLAHLLSIKKIKC